MTPFESAPLNSHVRAATHPGRLRLFARHDESVRGTPKLWFAILTYNALAYTKRCLLSLDLHTSEPWHAVILDNGSIDGTREWLATIDDRRITVELGSSNRGVAGGRNRLVELVRDHVPDDGWIVFIDNDLEFFPGWLNPFARLFSAERNVGIASCSGFEMLVHEHHRELLSYPGLIPMPVDVASGGFACFVRPAVFRAIGAYDEALNPFWHEDDDITVRARAAGWQAYAVPNAAVVHHGHKSGTANPAIAHLGSLTKQSYLVQKWRDAGLVASDGRLLYGQPFDRDELGEAMARRLHRRTSVRASEHQRARLDVVQLTDVLASGGSVAEKSRYASAPALALLEERASSEGASSTSSALRDAVLALRSARRRLTRLPVREGPPISVSKLADVRDWDDDAWYASALRYAGDGRGRGQWYDRRASTWDATQTVIALRAHGALSAQSRVLVVGDLRRPVVWGIAADVAHVAVADLLERYGADPLATVLDRPERFALREVPLDRVAAMSLASLASTAEPVRATAGVVLPWSDFTTATEQGALLQLLPRHLVAGAPIVTTVLVRLAGPPDARYLDSIARVPQWLTSLGLEPIDVADASLSDDALLAATDAEALESRTPNLLVADGARLFGRLLITCRARTAP